MPHQFESRIAYQTKGYLSIKNDDIKSKTYILEKISYYKKRHKNYRMRYIIAMAYNDYILHIALNKYSEEEHIGVYINESDLFSNNQNRVDYNVMNFMSNFT